MASPRKQAGRKQPAKGRQTTDVATRDAGEVSAFDAEFAGMQGMGMEEVTAKDIILPRIAIVQALSPELKENNSRYNPDAKVGKIIAVGMPDEYIWDELTFLPVVYRRQWLEWSPRESGRGLVAMHMTDAVLEDCTYNDRNQAINKNGNIIQDTMQFFGFTLNTVKPLASFIGMATTQIKKGKQWLTLATSEEVTGPDGNTFNPPLFYRTYQLGSAEESNAKGDWMGWTVNRGLKLHEHCEERELNFKSMMALARAFHRTLVEAEQVRSAEEQGGF